MSEAPSQASEAYRFATPEEARQRTLGYMAGLAVDSFLSGVPVWANIARRPVPPNNIREYFTPVLWRLEQVEDLTDPSTPFGGTYAVHHVKWYADSPGEVTNTCQVRASSRSDDPSPPTYHDGRDVPHLLTLYDVCCAQLRQVQDPPTLIKTTQAFTELALSVREQLPGEMKRAATQCIIAGMLVEGGVAFSEPDSTYLQLLRRIDDRAVNYTAMKAAAGVFFQQLIQGRVPAEYLSHQSQLAALPPPHIARTIARLVANDLISPDIYRRCIASGVVFRHPAYLQLVYNGLAAHGGQPALRRIEREAGGLTAYTYLDRLLTHYMSDTRRQPQHTALQKISLSIRGNYNGIARVPLIETANAIAQAANTRMQAAGKPESEWLPILPATTHAFLPEALMRILYHLKPVAPEHQAAVAEENEQHVALLEYILEAMRRGGPAMHVADLRLRYTDREIEQLEALMGTRPDAGATWAQVAHFRNMHLNK